MFDWINSLSPCCDVTSVRHSENVILWRKGETSSSHSCFVFHGCHLSIRAPSVFLAEMGPAMQPPCGAQL